MSTQVIEIEQTDTELFPYESSGGANVRTHIVSPPENTHIDNDGSLTAQDIVDLARISGQEVVALCGYRWVPKYNPKKHPVCEACVDIASRIVMG